MKKYRFHLIFASSIVTILFVYLVFPDDLDDFMKTRYYTFEKKRVQNITKTNKLEEAYQEYKTKNQRDSRYRLKNTIIKKLYNNYISNGNYEKAYKLVYNEFKTNPKNIHTTKLFLDEILKQNNSDTIDYYFKKSLHNFPNQYDLWRKYLCYFNSDSTYYNKLNSKYWSFFSVSDFSLYNNKNNYYADFLIKNENNISAIFEQTFVPFDTLLFYPLKFSKNNHLKINEVKLNGNLIDGVNFNEIEKITNNGCVNNIHGYSIIIPNVEEEIRFLEITCNVK